MPPCTVLISGMLQALKKRSDAYKKYSVTGEFINAGISEERKLTHAGTDKDGIAWGFAVFGGRVMLARGMFCA